MLKRRFQFWIELVLILTVSGLVYLPFITEFGYYNDDWYSMYAARVGGTQVFHEMYGIDRPGRAYVMIPLYELFQGNPLYYNIAAYVFRVLGAVCLLWLLRMIWPRRKNETFLTAFLFLIYPGFLSMPNAIDFQSHLIGIALAFISLALSVLAVRRGGNWALRLLLWGGAVLTGWAYLSQMEYYIGFEAIRLLLIGLLAWREHSVWKRMIAGTLYKWLPYSFIPGVYLFWRIFLFDNERATTDAGLQLGALLNAPLNTIYAWTSNAVQSFLNVTLLAWGVPLTQLSFGLDVSHAMRGMLLAVIVAAIFLLVMAWAGTNPSGTDDASLGWRWEMLVIGLLWTIAGLVVVMLGNRVVTFPVYSRYGLVSAAGGIMVLVAGLSYLNERRLQYALIGFLLFSAVYTHYGNGLYHARLSQSMRTFWWQVSWRVPQFVEGATLVASYPGSGIREDSFVWGPANHIYYPYRVNPNKIQAGVSAILLDQDAVVRILNRERQAFRRHIIVDTYRNYRNFVILSQPSPASCVQVIDGLQPEYSRSETSLIMVIGPYSETEHIALDEEFRVPPAFLFGTEPPHGWCYYYEKASYERQRGDWNAVLAIGQQAFSNGLFPRDTIEWMPFLQAYANTGDSVRLAELAPQVAADPFIARQACVIIKSNPSLSTDVLEIVDRDYCASN
jgi:hypothetical protein